MQIWEYDYYKNEVEDEDEEQHHKYIGTMTTKKRQDQKAKIKEELMPIA